MRESKVEKYFKKRVKETGGATRKYISPGRIGVADQLALYPYPVFYFVELKAPRKKPRTSQLREARRMVRIGYTYVVLDSFEAVDKFVKRAARRVAILSQ